MSENKDDNLKPDTDKASLEPCPTCEKEISTNAKLCPGCGEPLGVGWSAKIIQNSEEHISPSVDNKKEKIKPTLESVKKGGNKNNSKKSGVASIGIALSNLITIPFILFSIVGLMAGDVVTSLPMLVGAILINPFLGGKVFTEVSLSKRYFIVTLMVIVLVLLISEPSIRLITQEEFETTKNETIQSLTLDLESKNLTKLGSDLEQYKLVDDQELEFIRVEYKAQRIVELEQKVSSIPSSNHLANLEIYRELSKLSPHNLRYIGKVAHYEEAERLERERQRNAAQEEEERRATSEREAEARQEAEKRRKGFHCLSGWDGSHSVFSRAVEQRMRDPDSFEHIETRITPVDSRGNHTLIMSYRARNGFGGMTIGSATATIRNSDCRATIVSIE